MVEEAIGFFEKDSPGGTGIESSKEDASLWFFRRRLPLGIVADLQSWKASGP